MVAHATPARKVDENVVRGDGPKVLTQTGGCGSEDELTPRPAGHKFAQCNNPTSLFALDHAVASPLPAAMLCPKNSRLLRRDDRTGQKFAYVYFEDELGQQFTTTISNAGPRSCASQQI
jgi:hypothetical protein